MAVTLDKGFAFDGVAAALVPALGITFDAILEDFSAVTLGFAALVFPAAVLCKAGLAADLAAAGFASFAEGVRVFAGFIIALAMGSTITTWLLLPRGKPRVKPIYAHFNGLHPPAQCFQILFVRRMKLSA